MPMRIQHRMPHHSVYGITSPATDRLVSTTEIAREISCMTMKYFHVIVESPATKQRISSGKIGRMNMTVRSLRSFPLTFCSHLSSDSFPTSHAAAR